MHNIVKNGPKAFSCTVCRQAWTAPSKARCPGLPVIPYTERGALMSKTELSNRGYRVQGEPVACYRTADQNHKPVYVYLYDSALCERKRPSKKVRVVLHVDTLHWPMTWLWIFDRAKDYYDTLDDRGQQQIDHDPQNHRDPMWQRIARDIAEHASSLMTFSLEEIAPIAGETVALTFPLTGIRRVWGDSWAHQSEMHRFVQRLERAYREYKWRNRPPLTEEQWATIEARRQQREREEAAREAERRAKLFEMPAWITWKEGNQPPPVQLSLFD